MKLKDKILHPSKVVFSIGMHGGFQFLSDEAYLKMMYLCKFGKKLNITNPKTFNEKLQWLKLHDRNEKYTNLVDKFEVKNYVTSVIGKEYVIPTIGIWDSFEQIDFKELPDQFVLKCTHDSGGIVICKDKQNFDKSNARKIINKSLKKNYYWVGREWPYKNVKPRIIAEKYMSDETKSDLIDYKVHMFSGNPKFVLVCSERFSKDGLKEDFYDMDWKRMPVCRLTHPNSENGIQRPNTLDKMIEISKILSEKMQFARIDFYEVSGKLYFGEITLYPASGFEKFSPDETDEEFGKYLSI